MWRPFDDGRSLGQRGSESGVIVRDEEHADGARITLERDAAASAFAITCGIYGWMVHTRFFDGEAESTRAFEAMRVELAAIVDIIPPAGVPDPQSAASTVARAIAEFVKKFP